VSVTDDLRRYITLAADLFHGTEPPKEFRLKRVEALQHLDSGKSVDEVVAKSRFARRHLLVWHDVLQQEGLHGWLGKKEPTPERLKRARSGIAQMLQGELAEQHFETVSTDLLGAQGFRIEDQRRKRSDTDFRLVDPEGRGICRLNIKFHGTLFAQAAEYVGLEPRDCFALATYKIHGALQRQQSERLPYVFLIISVPDFPRDLIEENIGDDWAWLASLSGRDVEEAIANRLAQEPWAQIVRLKVGQSEFRVISARRANTLLRELLFDRVHALRLRGFNRTFRGAEINMHLSLSREMIAYPEFLKLLAGRGPLEVAVRLDRREI
jgi:hypothetical protein